MKALVDMLSSDPLRLREALVLSELVQRHPEPVAAQQLAFRAWGPTSMPRWPGRELHLMRKRLNSDLGRHGLRLASIDGGRFYKLERTRNA